MAASAGGGIRGRRAGRARSRDGPSDRALLEHGAARRTVPECAAAHAAAGYPDAVDVDWRACCVVKGGCKVSEYL